MDTLLIRKLSHIEISSLPN